MDLFDLPTLFAHRDLLADPEDAQPTLRFTTRAKVAPARRVAILSGSFNPPTLAHVLIAERARLTGCDQSVFVLPAKVAGKTPSGMIPEDRLSALRLIAPRAGATVAVATRGLYVDQARAAGEAFPGAQIVFVAGSDKVIQLFEPHWYQDRDQALEDLFSRATFLVSPRAVDGPRLRACLRDPDNARFADRINVVPLHPSVADLSSTRVRGLLEAGADASGSVPPAVATMLAELRPFARPQRHSGDVIDPYQIRARLIDALWHVREWAERAADLRALVRLAVSSTNEGRQIRHTLASGDPSAEDLVRLQSLATA